VSETGTRRPPRPEPGQAPQTRAEDAGRASRPAAAPTAQSASPYGPYPGRAGPRGPKGKKPWGWIIAGLVVIGLIAWVIIPHGPKGQAGPGGPGGRGGRNFGVASVNVAKATTTDMPIYLNALGTVTPTATVQVRAQVSGQLTRVAFTEGQMVKAGQVLAQIDPRPFQQTVNQALGVLARDQASLQNARVTLQRFQTLLAQDSIARQQVDDQAATVRSLEATIKSDEAQVGAARLNLSFATITAPVSGRVGLRQVDVGNYVTTGGTNPNGTTGIAVITQVAPIDVLFTIPEDTLPQVTRRIREGAQLPATALDRSQSTELAQGRLLTLDNQVDPATGTVKVKARFANADGALFPNQFVNIKLHIDTLKNAVAVPSSAVLRGSQGTIVYVVAEDRTVSIRQVKTGAISGANTAILEGLQVGETVVIDGTDRLREGGRVQLPGDCPPTGFPAGGQGGRRGGGQGGFQGQQQQSSGGLFGLFKKKTPPPEVPAGCRPMRPAGGDQGAAPGGASQGEGAPTSARPGAPRPEGPAIPGQARAEGARGPQGGGGQRLVAQLNLDAAQQAKADEIFAKARERSAASPASPDAFRQANRQAMADIEKILRPDQKARLDELRANARQASGNFGGGFGGGR
jgi:multidrug efflux system membrane fusion protein